jgi:general secretion pathway protein L
MARLLGIDCGPTAVRTALIRTSYRRVTVEAFGQAPVDDALGLPGVTEAAIRSAVGVHRPDAIAIALSGERAFYRRLDLPVAAAKELASVLAFELESTVPVDMESAVFDHRVLKESSTKTELSLFCAVAAVEAVKERIAVVKSAIGREPEMVAIGALPLANLALVMPDLVPSGPPLSSRLSSGNLAASDPVPIAILELGETTAEMVVLLRGEPHFARTLSRGTRGLPATAAALARDLRQTLAAWRSLGGAPIQTLYLVGGGAAVQGASPYLSAELGLSILPLPEPQLEGLTPEYRNELHLFAKALGLALGLDSRSRALNLRQGSLEAARSYPFLREKVPLISGLAAVIAVSFGFSIVAEMRSLGAERELLDAQLARVTEEAFGEPAVDVHAAREMLEKGPGAGGEDPMSKVDGFDVMVELSKAVPTGVAHDVAEFDVGKTAAGEMHATIQGTVPMESDAQKTAETVANVMKEQPCFQEVKITGTTQFNKERQKYTLEFDVRCGEKAKKKTSKKSGEENDE